MQRTTISVTPTAFIPADEVMRDVRTIERLDADLENANETIKGLRSEGMALGQYIAGMGSADAGIPANLNGIFKEEDIRFLSESAFEDACRPGNPRDTSVEEIQELYRSRID